MEKIWGKFLSFANASAGIIGIYFCIRTIKLIIDTVIHGYAIHSIYGWSVHLLGAIWDSITHLILHLSRKPQKKQTSQTEDQELLTITPNTQGNPNLSNRNSEISIENREL